MLHLKLKEETRVSHAALEKKMMEKIRSIRQMKDYVLFLNRLYGFYASIEKPIEEHLDRSEFPDIHRRRKADVLRNEILGIRPGSIASSYCDNLPAIHSEPAALGALYVLEGSTLGGGIVARIMQQQLNAAHEFNFFRSYGSDVNDMWTAFRRYLDRPYTHAEQSEIVRSAKETFTTLNDWLSGNGE